MHTSPAVWPATRPVTPPKRHVGWTANLFSPRSPAVCQPDTSEPEIRFSDNVNSNDPDIQPHPTENEAPLWREPSPAVPVPAWPPSPRAPLPPGEREEQPGQSACQLAAP